MTTEIDMVELYVYERSGNVIFKVLTNPKSNPVLLINQRAFSKILNRTNCSQLV